MKMITKAIKLQDINQKYNPCALDEDYARVVHDSKPNSLKIRFKEY